MRYFNASSKLYKLLMNQHNKSCRENSANPSQQSISQRLPKVWLIMGYRAGESAQILALAEALDWPFEIKRLKYHTYDFLPGFARIDTLMGINRDQSSPLVAPWPDLVISAGMRNEPICRWIKKQSGGNTKLVHLGRPWARLKHFDLIVTTPQYRLPPHPKIMQNTITMHRVSDKLLQAAASAWATRLMPLPQPYIAVIIGGNSGPYTFGCHAAKRLARQACEMAQSLGGSLLVSTSARTPAASIESFSSTVKCPMQLYRWTPDDTDNPYYSYLALAESIIVTGDSIAMLSESCATGKPVYIFDLGAGKESMQIPTAIKQNSELAGLSKSQKKNRSEEHTSELQSH